MPAVNSPAAELRTSDYHKLVPRLGLIIALLIYWLFAYALERANPAVPGLLQSLIAEGGTVGRLGELIYFWLSMFSPRVLRHFIPVVVGWWAARSLTVNVVNLLYNLSDKKTAGQMVSRLQNREIPHDLAQTLRQGEFADIRQSLPLLVVGGPGRVEIEASNAIVTELNGRFQRVLGPGKHSLFRFERVYAILDLRLQERTQTGIKLMTRDGIELETDLTIAFRIKRGEAVVTKATPFPFDKEAARQAAYAQTALTGGAVSNWQTHSLTTAVSKLRDYVAAQPLDNLFNLEQNTAVYDALHRHVLNEANAMLAATGVIVEKAQLGKLAVTHTAVTEQRIRYWQTLRANASLLNMADGQAEIINTVEMVRVEAEATMIETIVEAIQRAQREGKPGTTRQITALRLIESLERMTRQNEQIMPITDTINQQLREINQRLTLERPSDAPANRPNNLR